MTKLNVGILSALFAAAAATIAVQYQANTRLREQYSRLEEQTRDDSLLQGQILKLTQEAQAARKAATAAPAPLPVQKPPANPPAGKPALAAGLVPVGTFTNVGRTTARGAFETQLWAAHSGDVAATAASITFGPEGRALLEEARSKLPQAMQDQYPTPEMLMAFALAGSPHPVGGMQVLGESKLDSGDMVLQTQWQHEDDAIVHTTEALLRKTDDGWKLVVPFSVVQRAAAYVTRSAVH